MDKSPLHKVVGSLLLLLISFTVSAQDDFAGPFKTWANVKTRFGAKGDGKTNDTKKLQAAIDGLANGELGTNMSGPNPYVVIYLPAGTYLISETLMLKGKVGVSIIGEDPQNTFIKWTGKDDDTMLLADGSAYFKVARINWQSNKKKKLEAVGVHWLNKWNDGKSRSYATLNIELSDMVFTDFAVGIGGGTYAGRGTGSNDSEITIRRCKFVNCTEAGIQILGFNALDYWIWNCSFTNCKYGVYCGNGNYHAYRCNFKNSGASDFFNRGGYYTSVRECYSYGSKSFSVDEGSSCNPFKRIFQKNTVINYKAYPIEYYHLGNLTLFDNKFPVPVSAKESAEVILGGWCPGFYSLLSLNNQYASTEPVSIGNPRRKLIRFDGNKAARTAPNSKSIDPILPQAAMKTIRPVIELSPGATTEAIQQAINKASAQKGKKAIVHFAMGAYTIDKTLTVPAESDILICGEGLLFSTQLLAKKGSLKPGQPLILINGPSSVKITDMQIGLHVTGNPASSAIHYKNIDQPGSRMIVDQVYSSADTSMNLDGMNYIYVEKNNSFFSEGNYITGGAKQAAGMGTFKVNYNGSQFARLTVKNNAHFIAKDCWWEGKLRVPLELEGDGAITIDGGMIAPTYVDSTPTIKIKKFDGKIALMNMYIQGGWSIDPSSTRLYFLGWNIHFYYKTTPGDIANNVPGIRTMLGGLTSQCFDEKKEACKSIMSFEPISKNVKDEKAFLESLTEDARTSLPVTSLSSNTKGASSVYISRVSIGSANSAVKVTNDR